MPAVLYVRELLEHIIHYLPQEEDLFTCLRVYTNPNLAIKDSTKLPKHM